MPRRAALALAALLALLAACARRDVVNEGDERGIRPGMSYAQVAAIIGKPGQKIDVKPELRAEFGNHHRADTVYLWRNKDGSNLTADFWQDHVITMSGCNLDGPWAPPKGDCEAQLRAESELGPH